jgi:hypothetical protein
MDQDLGEVAANPQIHIFFCIRQGAAGDFPSDSIYGIASLAWRVASIRYREDFLGWSFEQKACIETDLNLKKSECGDYRGTC